MAEGKFTTALSQWSNTITDLVARDYEACGVQFEDYSKQCAMSAMTSIYQLVKETDKADMNSMDTSNLREIVGHCASLKLNANAYPRECYFQIRSKKIGNQYVKVVEMGIEGDGNDAILRNFGVNVKMVHPVWIVHEGDEFVYPKRKGLDVCPPEWEEKGVSQKVTKVVYPVELLDGSVQYLISERDSVKTNLFAHVRNNLMNETFGICKSRYDATDKQKAEINAKKEEVYAALRECETVDDMLKCEKAIPYMSGAWLDTPESMIVRKMRNNAIKKFPKDYDSMARQAYIQMDDAYVQSREDINADANSSDFADVIVEENGEVVVDD